MIYQVAADLVLLFHFAFVLFVVLGLVAIYLGGWLRWRWVRSRPFRLIHLLAIGVVIIQAWLGVVCPLTTLEDHLRGMAGEKRYETDFLEYWLHRCLFLDASRWVFLVAYTVFGSLVGASWWVVKPDVSHSTAAEGSP